MNFLIMKIETKGGESIAKFGSVFFRFFHGVFGSNVVVEHALQQISSRIFRFQTNALIGDFQSLFILFNQLEIDLNNLRTLLDHNKVLEVKELLTKIVKTYQSNTAIVDHVYLEQSKLDKCSFVPVDEGNKVVKIKNN